MIDDIEGSDFINASIIQVIEFNKLETNFLNFILKFNLKLIFRTRLEKKSILQHKVIVKNHFLRK